MIEWKMGRRSGSAAPLNPTLKHRPGAGAWGYTSTLRSGGAVNSFSPISSRLFDLYGQPELTSSRVALGSQPPIIAGTAQSHLSPHCSTVAPPDTMHCF